MKNIFKILVLITWITSETLFASEAQEVTSAVEAKSEDQSVSAEFSGLGGSKSLIDKAKALEPETNVSVVQNRFVPRTNRIEFAPEFSGTFGGDSYTKTQSIGFNLHYHFNPRWSIGAKYNHSYNALTPEGEARMEAAMNDFKKNPGKPGVSFPGVDYQKNEYMALINWYPIYGKLNLIDKGVLHFDLYFIGGAGQATMASGATSTVTGGMGLGFWFTKNFTSRLEMRYQNQTAKYLDDEKKLDLAIASMQMGWML